MKLKLTVKLFPALPAESIYKKEKLSSSIPTWLHDEENSRYVNRHRCINRIIHIYLHICIYEVLVLVVLLVLVFVFVRVFVLMLVLVLACPWDYSPKYTTHEVKTKRRSRV